MQSNASASEDDGLSGPTAGLASYFTCPVCGTSEPSTAVAYTRYGYPQCPACGFVARSPT
ncbi:MAG: hypothetical protein ABEJ31_05435 [Haloarculaceae archaeon]